MKVSELPEIDIESPGFATNPDDADAFMADFRAEHEIARSQRGVEILTYEALSELFRHPGFNEDVGARLEGAGIGDGPIYDGMANLLNNVDGPDHIRMRRVVTPWFSKRGAERFRDDIRGWALEQLKLDDKQCDFVNTVGLYLPAVAFCKTLGAPLDDAELVAEINIGLVRPLNSALTPEARPSIEAAAERGWDYIRGMIADRRENPGKDLISVMLEAETRGEINEHEMVDVLFTMLVASTETTGGQIAMNVVTLAAHPDQWQVLKDGGDELIPGAVVELMRFNPVNMSSVVRTCKRPAEFRGVEITPEDTIWGNTFLASRDPSAYPKPRQLDVTRRSNKPLLNFGFGRHSCLGRMIAVMEQEEVLRACLREWESLEILESRVVGPPYVQAAEKLVVGFKRAA